MTRRTILALILALVAAACTPSSSSADEGLPGRLVILDRGGNVATVAPNGEELVQVTRDAGDGAAYVQPIWSPDSTRLAWGQVTDAGPATAFWEADGGPTTVIPMSSPPFYLYWSPDSEAIGVLHNGQGARLDFEIVDVGAGEAAVVDRGVPYYFSWNPDGGEVVTHVGGQGLATVDIAGVRSELGSTASGYLAPQWVPGGILHIVDDALVMESGDDRVQVALLPGPAAFVANPRGSLVAIQSLREVGGTPAAFRPQAQQTELIPVNVVVVVDTASGEQTVVSDTSAVGFFWSPGGERLLILRLSASGAALEPLVWQRGGEVTQYPQFSPHGSFVREVLPFFPQYAQSMNLWAPDSSAFAYAGEVGEERGIWVQELSESRPRFVTVGTWVAWSGE